MLDNDNYVECYIETSVTYLSLFQTSLVRYIIVDPQNIEKTLFCMRITEEYPSQSQFFTLSHPGILLSTIRKSRKVCAFFVNSLKPRAFSKDYVMSL